MAESVSTTHWGACVEVSGLCHLILFPYLLFHCVFTSSSVCATHSPTPNLISTFRRVHSPWPPVSLSTSHSFPGYDSRPQSPRRFIPLHLFSTSLHDPHPTFPLPRCLHRFTPDKINLFSVIDRLSESEEKTAGKHLDIRIHT